MSEPQPEVGAIYKWIGGKDFDSDLEVAHYLVIQFEHQIYWTCIELETGRIGEFSFHGGNWNLWELCL